jgi:hypothetical protein
MALLVPLFSGLLSIELKFEIGLQHERNFSHGLVMKGCVLAF